MKIPESKIHFSYLIVGFASLIGGIAMFAFIVVPQLQPETGVPRDVQLIFTELFSQQSLVRRETGKFTPALIQVGVNQDVCRRYSCLLTLTEKSDGYEFRLGKDGKNWHITHHSPVPKEIP